MGGVRWLKAEGRHKVAVAELEPWRRRPPSSDLACGLTHLHR